MGNEHYPGLATIVTTARAMCKALTQFLPRLALIMPEPEKTALQVLHVACQDLLALAPFPGTDDDPGTIE